jgi:hypothetical protein
MEGKGLLKFRAMLLASVLDFVLGDLPSHMTLSQSFLDSVEL